MPERYVFRLSILSMPQRALKRSLQHARLRPNWYRHPPFLLLVCSGGKDSCYNMLLCQKHGHEIIALGNLLPAAAGVDELDSYMFQTVGHNVIPMYAECMGVPLYRRHISGSSVHQVLLSHLQDPQCADLASSMISTHCCIHRKCAGSCPRLLRMSGTLPWHHFVELMGLEAITH